MKEFDDGLSVKDWDEDERQRGRVLVYNGGVIRDRQKCEIASIGIRAVYKVFMESHVKNENQSGITVTLLLPWIVQRTNQRYRISQSSILSRTNASAEKPTAHSAPRVEVNPERIARSGP